MRRGSSSVCLTCAIGSRSQFICIVCRTGRGRKRRRGTGCTGSAGLNNMAIFALVDATGGVSDEPPQTLAPNQVQIAQNVNFWKAPLGARRNGSVLLVSGTNNAQFVAGAQPNNQFVWTMDSSGVI